MLGDELDDLHPRLAAYFSAIPAGRVGFGRGVFSDVGTPRRWLYPILALLGRPGVVFPVWEHDVPFTVENRADGEYLRARRVFEFHRGARVMVDAISVDDGVLSDQLGVSGAIRARFRAEVVDGAMHLESRRITWYRIPIPLAPTVRLVERFDERLDGGVGRQHVTLTLDAPLLGRLYGYSGFFDYSIVEVQEVPA